MTEVNWWLEAHALIHIITGLTILFFVFHLPRKGWKRRGPHVALIAGAIVGLEFALMDIMVWERFVWWAERNADEYMNFREKVGLEAREKGLKDYIFDTGRKMVFWMLVCVIFYGVGRFFSRWNKKFKRNQAPGPLDRVA